MRWCSGYGPCGQYALRFSRWLESMLAAVQQPGRMQQHWGLQGFGGMTCFRDHEYQQELAQAHASLHAVEHA